MKIYLPHAAAVFSAAVLSFLSASFVHAQAPVPPAWWEEYGVVRKDVTPANGAMLNQGQLKNFTMAAIRYVDAVTGHIQSGGEARRKMFELGFELQAALTAVGTDAGANRVALQGHVKRMAATIFDRLAEVGFFRPDPNSPPKALYPWPTSLEPNGRAANIGMIKRLFQFDLEKDGDNDGTPDWFEAIQPANGAVFGSDMIFQPSTAFSNAWAAGMSPIAPRELFYAAQVIDTLSNDFEKIRFLNQATYGANPESLAAFTFPTISAWIANQADKVAQPISRYLPKSIIYGNTEPDSDPDPLLSEPDKRSVRFIRISDLDAYDPRETAKAFWQGGWTATTSQIDPGLPDAGKWTLIPQTASITYDPFGTSWSSKPYRADAPDGPLRPRQQFLMPSMELFSPPASIPSSITIVPNSNGTGLKRYSADKRGADSFVVANDYPLQATPLYFSHHHISRIYAHALHSTDQLRQRMAFALSQILVVSAEDPDLDSNGSWTLERMVLADYHDLLMKHAFGNYRTLVEEVTRHVAMGRYLDLLGSHFSAPNQNFARELMQLFTIGQEELAMDGSVILAGGEPVPSYDGYDDVLAASRVLTGWYFNQKFMGQPTNGIWGIVPNPTPFGLENPQVLVPYIANGEFLRLMIGWDKWHDHGQAVFEFPVLRPNETTAPRFIRGDNDPRLNFTANAGFTIGEVPNGQTPPDNFTRSPENDLRRLLDQLVFHRNTAPFISKQLIQFFVTSNPSRGYVFRVAKVFRDKQQEPDQLRHVITAILTDREARDLQIASQPGFGLLREPQIRIFHAARLLNGGSFPMQLVRVPHQRTNPTPPAVPETLGTYSLGDHHVMGLYTPWDSLGQMTRKLGEASMQSPSVFNFFRPNYPPGGELQRSGLVSPVMQISGNDRMRLWLDASYNLSFFRLDGGSNLAGLYLLNRPSLTASIAAQLKHDLANLPHQWSDPSSTNRQTFLLDLNKFMCGLGNAGDDVGLTAKVTAVNGIAGSGYSQNVGPNDFLSGNFIIDWWVREAVYLTLLSPKFCVQR